MTQKKDCTDKIVQNDQGCAIKIVFYRTQTRHAFATAFSIEAFIELGKVARLTGLEPATSGVTGRHSNQLSYNRAYLPFGGDKWWVMRGSNSRHLPCKGSALPTELITR